MICERYDVVVVPYPFHEVPIAKRRPTVVLSGKTFNARNRNTLVAMITTAKETSWPTDVSIGDLDLAGLLLPCVIRLRLQTLPNESFIRGLGRLGALDRLQCERQLAEMLL